MHEGQRVDRYRVDKRLYEGELTTVVRATHEYLGSRHALKIQQREVPEEIPDALLREGRLQRSIHHRNVLHCSDAFEWDRRVVLVFDWVRTESLADLLARRPVLPPRAALGIFRGVVRGVRALHVAHIVHRDLKPENILLTQDEGRIVPKVADFGLAKLLDPGQEPEPSGLSLSFRYLGTPEYMAPEQAQDPGRVDTRADLFSLGALLYELVTGHVAFDAESSTDSMYKAAKGDYLHPTARNPDVPDEVVEAIQGLLQPKVAKRIQSCETLLVKLDGIRG